ncbi:MAG: glycosyltransferase family 4 protein [Phycisphaerae bacterium]
MHIAYVAGLFPLLSETFVWREVRELRRRGHTVTCVSLREPEYLPEDLADLAEGRIVVYPALGKPGVGSLRGLPDALLPGEGMSRNDRAKLLVQAAAGVRLGRQLKAAGVRHIHAHFAHAPATVAMYAAQAAGVPFSFTGHANDLFERRSLLRRKLQRAAFVACISDWHRRLYEEIEPASAGRLRVIRCGVDTTQFAPVPQERDGPLHLLTVCRLVEKKGVDALLRGAARFGRETGRAWKLTIAGTGPLWQDLVAAAHKLDVEQHVAFLGAVPNEQVRQLVQEADVFALPCRVDRNGDKDGIPVVLMEAMAAGLPVLAGDLEAIRELVKDGETGLIVDGTDDASVAAAVARLEADPDLRRRLGQAGRGWVEQEFSLKVNVDRLEAAVGRPA